MGDDYDVLTTSLVDGFRFRSGPIRAGDSVQPKEVRPVSGEPGSAWHYSAGARGGHNGLIPGPSCAPELSGAKSFVETVRSRVFCP